MAGASRPEVARDPLTGSEARRFSAFREIAKAFAPRYSGRSGLWLGLRARRGGVRRRGRGHRPGERQPGTAAIRKIARLRETALARAAGMADARTPATHGVLATVMSLAGYLKAEDAPTLLQAAASIARAHAPRNDDALAKLQAEASERDTLLDLETASPAERAPWPKPYGWTARTSRCAWSRIPAPSTDVPVRRRQRPDGSRRRLRPGA